MKIILDDLRDFPTNGYYNCCRTYDDCVLLIDIFREISFISLDYNLSDNHKGYEVLVFLKEKNIQPEHINIHSDDIRGIEKMEIYIKENFKNASFSKNSLR